MTSQPLMPKATAVWLVENTALSFDQIAEFCKLHPLEVKAIADGDAAQGIKGLDPVLTGQLSREDIEAAEANPGRRLKLADPKVRLPETKSKKKGPRYTPVSRRQDRPNAILWLIRNHPELKDSQIMRLVGTTKSTIQAIRDRTHWNAANLTPLDPVTLGLCSQIDLDLEVQRAAKEKPAEAGAERRAIRERCLALRGLNAPAPCGLTSYPAANPWPFSATPISSRTAGSSIVAGKFQGSPSAIFFMVPRRILPDRVLGRRVTVMASLNAATGPIRSRTKATISRSIASGGRSTPALSTMKPQGTSPLSSSLTPITAHSATSGCEDSTSSMPPVESR